MGLLLGKSRARHRERLGLRVALLGLSAVDRLVCQVERLVVVRTALVADELPVREALLESRVERQLALALRLLVAQRARHLVFLVVARTRLLRALKVTCRVDAEAVLVCHPERTRDLLVGVLEHLRPRLEATPVLLEGGPRHKGGHALGEDAPAVVLRGGLALVQQSPVPLHGGKVLIG